MPEDRIAESLYEQDFGAWATDQAAALRAAGGTIPGGQDGPAELLRSLDWDNLAEEIEGLARRDRRELGNRLVVIIEHLAKLEFSPAAGPRAGWGETILRERPQIGAILRDSPSLYGSVPLFLTSRMDEAIQLAAGSLELYGEIEAAGRMRALRLGRGYSRDEVLGSWILDAQQP